MNIFFLAPPIFLGLYLTWISPVRVLRWLAADPMGERLPEWPLIQARAKALAHVHRFPAPTLWLLPDFSPNALVLRSGSRVHIALTHGLVRALSEEELDCALSLALCHGHGRGRAAKTRLALALFPALGRLERAPLPVYFLLYPVAFVITRFTVGFSSCIRADKRAAQVHGSLKVAAALQKMGVLLAKIPPRRWSLALDGLFLLSPLRAEGGPFGSLVGIPSLAKRRSALLRAASCESSPSLP